MRKALTVEILGYSLFSFPGKNLGAYGDGGAVVTNNKKIYKSILQLRTHGALKNLNMMLLE